MEYTYHIKRDAAWLCKADLGRPLARFYKMDGYITFSQAHRSKLENCCKDCIKRYYEIVSKLDIPIMFEVK